MSKTNFKKNYNNNENRLAPSAKFVQSKIISRNVLKEICQFKKHQSMYIRQIKSDEFRVHA